MRKIILAAAAAATIGSPAMARDGQGYVGIEGGLLFPRDQDVDITLDGTDEGFGDGTYDDAIGIDYNTGVDLDLIAGYDFGMFRLEGELGWKKAGLDDLEFSDDLIDAVATDVGLDADFDDLDLDGHVRVLSGMINGLVDFGDDDGVNFYAGLGFGRAGVKVLGEKDSAWAWQLLAGVRYAVSPSVDIGLKYRYFRTGRLDFFDGDDVIFTDGFATATADFDEHFRSHSLLASLIFNFGEPAMAPPPPPPPPPPPEPAPATQTCYDGSVILATDMCPTPPPPPPPPPAPERG